MTNNDILRRVRYILDFNDSKMISIFKSAELEVTKEQLTKWLKKDDDVDFENCNDPQLASFLNGLINEKRGKREGEQPAPEKSLTNNIILRKLMIAFTLKSDDVISLLELADLRVSKHELSAFFRKPGHKNYRECQSQILRNFLSGLQIKLRNT
jgi:uncharacterized protein YehS (DUF1456 family)